MPAGLSAHPLFDPAYVRRRLGAKRLARLGDGDRLTFVLQRGLRLATHPLLTPSAEGLVPGDPATWIRQRYAGAGQQPGTPPNDPAMASIIATCREAPENALNAARAAAETAGDGARSWSWTPPTRPPTASCSTRWWGCPACASCGGVPSPWGEIVVLLHDDAAPERGWLPPLVAALETPSVLAASPLLIAPSGAIESAGVVYPTPGGLPHRLLADFPAEDAAAVGALRFPALSGGALALRRDDLITLGPDDTLGELAEADLCRRLAVARAGRFRVVTESRVRHGGHPVDAAARARFDECDHRPPRGGDETRFWAACGFRVVGHEVRPLGADTPRRLGLVAPVVAREVRLHVSETPGPLRWAIKNPAPSNPGER